jgi:ABC-type transport system involved in multi-copper enzyme maturation permease subunit
MEIWYVLYSLISFITLILIICFTGKNFKISYILLVIMWPLTIMFSLLFISIVTIIMFIENKKKKNNL